RLGSGHARTQVNEIALCAKNSALARDPASEVDVHVNVSVTDPGIEHRLHRAPGHGIDEDSGVSAVDHPDRVVDAIARATLEDGETRIGLDQTELHQHADRRSRVLTADDCS